MLPTGHVEFTWTGLHLLQTRLGLFGDADARWVALVALAPDLLDKPLALTVYRQTDAALFWGHNLWLHLALWSGALLWSAAGRNRHGAGQARFGRVLPYLLAFSGHLVADRMWGFQESLLYPLGAGFWHPWVHVGEPTAMLAAYIDIIRTTPVLVAFEVVGFGLLMWVAHERGWITRLRNLSRSLPFSSLRPRSQRTVEDEA